MHDLIDIHKIPLFRSSLITACVNVPELFDCIARKFHRKRNRSTGDSRTNENYVEDIINYFQKGKRNGDVRYIFVTKFNETIDNENINNDATVKQLTDSVYNIWKNKIYPSSRTLQSIINGSTQIKKPTEYINGEIVRLKSIEDGYFTRI